MVVYGFYEVLIIFVSCVEKCCEVKLCEECYYDDEEEVDIEFDIDNDK